MKVLAFICVYNEADILPWTLQKLAEQGVMAYVIDNWSTDGSWNIAQDNGPCERWPEKDAGKYQWGDMLTHVENRAMQFQAGFDWMTLHDADEIRRPHDPKLTFLDALRAADDRGYNLIDHSCRHYHPVDNNWTPADDPEIYFRYYKPHQGVSTMVKTWKTIDRPVIAASGGHIIRFQTKKGCVFPEKFLLKHYPFRTQEQARRKVFEERLPRYTGKELDKSWHQQYKRLAANHRFVLNHEDLTLDISQ